VAPTEEKDLAAIKLEAMEGIMTVLVLLKAEFNALDVMISDKLN
jgi:hypothetical protein